MRAVMLSLLLVLPIAPAAAQTGASDTLEIYVVDVEGGEATLFVDPSGESLLVDTGWPGFGGRDAERIAAAARQAGGDAHNPPERFIANLEEGTPQADGRTVHMGPAHWVHASARRDGSFTVTNSRNGFSRTYGPRE